MSAALEITSRREGDKAAVLSLAGEVDVANTPQVRDTALQLVSAGVVRLVIDLSTWTALGWVRWSGCISG